MDACGALETGQLAKKSAAKVAHPRENGDPEFLAKTGSPRSERWMVQTVPYAAAALAEVSTKASKSGFTVSAWVVHMPCGKPL